MEVVSDIVKCSTVIRHKHYSHQINKDSEQMINGNSMHYIITMHMSV